MITLLVFVTIAIAAGLVCLVWDRVHRRMRKERIEQFNKDYESGKIPKDFGEDPGNGVIEITGEAISVSVKEAKADDTDSIRWDEINKIVVFKRDLFTVDAICWCFCRTDEEDVVEVNETMSGYLKLIEAVQSRFAIAEDWWEKVYTPPFATNMRVIWARENGR